MAFAESIRSIGRGGLFGLTMLRGSVPTRDFLAELVREIYKVGARSLPIIAVGGAFVGLVLTLQGYRTLSTYGAVDALSTLLGLSLYRELAPVLTALLFIGRAGSSIAAELGLMRATDQIKALELMAIDPVAKVVAPRFWAAVLTMPLLAGIFASIPFAIWFFLAIVVPVMRGKGPKAAQYPWEAAEGLEWEVPSPAPFHTYENPPKLDVTATKVIHEGTH